MNVICSGMTKTIRPLPEGRAFLVLYRFLVLVGLVKTFKTFKTSFLVLVGLVKTI